MQIPDLPVFELKPVLLLWEAFVSMALVGYGFGTLRMLREDQQPLGVAACTGVSVWLFLGGLLNLLHLATRPVLWVLLVVGFGLFAAELRRADVRGRLRAGLRGLKPSSWGIAVVAGVIGLYLLLCAVSHLGIFAWNKFDDVQAYMPFADQASALGTTPSQPFSERRITSGVGGSIFLGITMLSGAGDIAQDFLDGTFGFVALLLCLYAVTREFRLSRWRCVAVFYAAGLFTYGRVNLTAIHLSAALFLCVLLLLLQTPALRDMTANRAGLIGVLLAAGFALKSSNIPFSVALLGILFTIELIRKPAGRWVRVLAWMTVAALIAFAPWAFKHYLDENTALFPSLGRGYHLSAYGFPTISQTVPAVISVLDCFWSFVLPGLAALLGWLLLRRVSFLRRAPLLAFFAAAALTAPLFSISIAAENIDRFLLPTGNLCFLLFLMIFLAATSVESASHWLWPAAEVIVFWIVLFLHKAVPEDFFRDAGSIALLADPRHYDIYLQPYEEWLLASDLARNRAQVQRAQSSVPAGMQILENVEAAYGFNWKRNPILFADYPGMASLPPGFPLDGNSEAARKYLLSKGIHYVMLDRELFHPSEYAEFRRHPQVSIQWQDMLDIWDPPTVQGYAVMEYRVSNQARDLLAGIAAQHPPLYNDGRLEVLCLDCSR